MFEKILICTDFADGLHRLANYAASLAAGGIKHIVFLHAVPLSETGIYPKIDSEQIEQAQARLTAAVGVSPAGVDITVEVQSGRAAQTILKVAKSYQSELIVLGSQMHNLLTEKLTGSVLDDLSHQTTIPLLILRPQLISALTSEELTLRCQHLLRYLLIPYDGSESATYLVQQVKQLAQKQSNCFLERCRLCWVLNDLPTQSECDNLLQVKSDLETVNLQAEGDFHQGVALTEILKVAQMSDVSAIAIASGTIGKFQEWIISSLTTELLRQSWCPVLFFPRRP